MSNSILQYESKVWQTADLLIGAGIKQSDFPKYMMPFFALIMVESRLVRESRRLLEEFGKEKLEDFNKEELEDFIEEFAAFDLGYNDFVIRQNKTLQDLCKNDKTFTLDFDNYLKSFDSETKNLLGVDKGNEEEKYLNISGICGLLNKKKILFATVKAWSSIDLIPFNNSEITTLEEHIKRKWADISAETAGEQYTPDDIIALIAEIIVSKTENNENYLTIYDPTCGGGNMLFGVEDHLKKQFDRPTKTYGEDWNDTLYALAKIESRFREESEIEHGNTLTDMKFWGNQFDLIVANPPYGVDWKGYKSDIEKDKTDRFVALPSVSDGQLLFTQHIISQLKEDGLSIVVHNGSTLFSGDAGSGESNIRKYLFDKDYVEAIIQLPTDEFFNTGIYTYLWIFNKSKAPERKDKVMLINASDHFEPLKKSKGKKRKEMAAHNREAILKALTKFENNDYAKVFDKWHFYFNKQAIRLTNVDDKGNSLEAQLPVSTNKKTGEQKTAKSIKLNPSRIIQYGEEDTETIEITDFVLTDFDTKQYKTLKDYHDQYIKGLLQELDYKEEDLHIHTAEGLYFYDVEKNTIIREGRERTVLGNGIIQIKSSFKKATKTKAAAIQINVELLPDYQKDYEIIPYNPNPNQNQQDIADFMAKYISKPFVYLDNVVGVEINFNKVFYQPEILRPVNNIMSDLDTLNTELKTLENSLKL